MVLNSYETIYEGLVTRANDFAGRSSLVRMKMLVDNCDNIAFSTFSPKWIQMKKITMQTLKVWSVIVISLQQCTMFPCLPIFYTLVY